MDTTTPKAYKPQLTMLYKIIHGLAPSYLTAILPRPRDAGYRLRSLDNMSLPTPFARLSCVKNSFLNSSITSLNSLDKIIRSSSSYLSFKSKLLKRNKCNSHFNPILYSRFLGKAAVNHTRMRLGLSVLNSQRYKYNMVPSTSCERPVSYIFRVSSLCCPSTSIDPRCEPYTFCRHTSK